MLRIGFVPLIDCAPLAVAQELGIFARHGLQVKLSREPGWATIRDKVLYREIDAAHAIAGLAISLSYGLGSPQSHCLTGFLFNSHGNAITLSTELTEAGVTGAKSLDIYTRTYRRNQPVTLAVVHCYSSHHFLLHTWLRKAGLKASEYLRLIVLPPPLVARNLELGHIDGFCAGEPYNTLAQERDVGKIVALSADLVPLHPEKALIVRQDFAEKNEAEHLTLIRALDEACNFCDQAENRAELATLLASRKYLDFPKSLLEKSLSITANGEMDMHLYHRFEVNRPTQAKANWLIGEMRHANLVTDQVLKAGPKLSEIFREDIYDQAMS